MTYVSIWYGARELSIERIVIYKKFDILPPTIRKEIILQMCWCRSEEAILILYHDLIHISRDIARHMNATAAYVARSPEPRQTFQIKRLQLPGKYLGLA